MTTSPSITPALLRDPGVGTVHLPGGPGYEAARLAWAALADQRPAAVAVPQDEAEVAALVRAAHRAGLRVAAQSTGHNAGPLAAQDLGDVLLVRTGALSSVHVDPPARTARVGGGTVWLPAVEAAASYGLAALHGSAPDVGIAGYSLGGGTGWYARTLGLAANSLTAVELVTADGELVRADDRNEPDLFWALRGGGGSFGVVTALEFRLYPIETAYAGMLVWDASDAERVLRTWARWAAGAPDEVTTVLRIMHVPPVPEAPELLRGRHLVIIDGAVLAGDERAGSILAELRALRPELDTFTRVPAAALARLHMDPEHPTPGVSAGTLLRGLPDAAVDAVLTETGPGAPSSLWMVELLQLGGALGRRHVGGGALDRFAGAFGVLGVAVAPTPELAARGRADATTLVSALSPYASGRQYLNFAEDPVDARTAFDPDAWTRLTAVRDAVDPDRLFVANHPVGDPVR